MKIENSWINLTLLKVENPGTNKAFKLVEYQKNKIFRIDNEVNELDQIIMSDDPEYYICFEILKDIDIEGLVPEFHITYMTLNDYYIYQFHTILDNEYLSWQEKPEMIRDLSNDISNIFSACKVFDF
jgi:hypothetical protein